MFWKSFFLVFMASVALCACGTFQVSIYQKPTTTLPTETPTLPLPTKSPTRTSTVEARLTSAPTFTPDIPCEKAEFIMDVTVPDGTKLQPREAFTKTWRLKNVGTCTWTPAYDLMFVSGELMGMSEPQPLATEVAPGKTVDISVNMLAPAALGSYQSYWGLENDSGERVPIVGNLDGTFYVDIKVVGPDFKVTLDSLTVTCHKPNYFTATAMIRSNGSGTSKYRWSTGGVEPLPPESLVFNDASTQTITHDFAFSLADPGHPEWDWLRLDVTEPDEFTSGQVPRKCP